jgi:hypothetical protein
MPYPLSSIGIEMPDDFPTQPYEAIHNRMSIKRDSYLDAWREFAAAWNAVAYRFLSCTEHDKAFTESVKRFGKTPPHFEWYIQQRELFGFFVTGFSCIESFCYALFAIGAILEPTKFPFVTPKEKKEVSWKKTINNYEGAFPNEELTILLSKLEENEKFKEWRTVRNILSHRCAPGRHIYVGGYIEVTWIQNIKINEDTTSLRRKWLVNLLNKLMNAANKFTANKFKL